MLNQLAVERDRRADVGVAQFASGRRDRVEDRLDVGLRLADHAQDLAGRRLLLQRFRQVAIARFQLREQAHVLDRDHCLVGERLQQPICASGNGLAIIAIHGDRSDRLPVAQHRHGKHAAEVGSLGDVAVLYSGSGADVGNVDDAAGQDRAAGRRAPARGHGYAAQRRVGLEDPGSGSRAMWISSPSKRKSALTSASHRRKALAAIVVEHRLHFGRRALITRRISLVAVCCSSASCVAWNRRTLAIAIAAGVATSRPRRPGRARTARARGATGRLRHMRCPRE